MKVWTFFRVGNVDSEQGIYDERYEPAATEGIDRTSGGTFRAEFVHDADLPEWLRQRGWWSFMQAFNPDASIGNDDGTVYVAGIDIAFLRDLPRLVAAFDEVDRDVVGCPCFGDKMYNSFAFRVRRGTPGANAVWAAFVAKKEMNGMEHVFVRRHCPSLGVIPPGLVVSYKAEIGVHWAGPSGNLDSAVALAFHGKPRPHEVHAQKGKVNDVVTQCWIP